MNKITRLAATGGVSVLIAAALAVGGAAITAQAHTPSVTSTCSALSVNLTNYAQGSEGTSATEAVYNDWDETVIDSPAVAAVDAVTHTEYEFQQIITGHTRWETNPNWNAESNYHSIGWFATGNTKVVVDSPAVDAIPAVTHVVHHHDLVTPGTDATEGHTNTVVVTIDGSEVENTTFDTTFVKSYDYGNQYVAHTYTVVVTAWDDSQYNVDTSGTSEPCTLPVPEKPAPVVTTNTVVGQPDCDAKTVTTTTTVTTTEYVLVENEWVLGEPSVVVTPVTRDATAEECPVVVPPTVTPPPVTPAVVTPTTPPESLAFTGQDNTWPILIGVAAIIAGLGLTFFRRRKV